MTFFGEQYHKNDGRMRDVRGGQGLEKLRGYGYPLCHWEGPFQEVRLPRCGRQGIPSFLATPQFFRYWPTTNVYLTIRTRFLTKSRQNLVAFIIS